MKPFQAVFSSQGKLWIKGALLCEPCVSLRRDIHTRETLAGLSKGCYHQNLSSFCKMVEPHTEKTRYLIRLSAVFIKKRF